MIHYHLKPLFGNEWYYVGLYLALFALCIAMPVKFLFRNSGRFRSRPLRSLGLFMLGFPLLESAIFWFALFPYLMRTFPQMVAIIFLGVAYAIYSVIIYGTASAGEGLILAVLFGFALLQFGLAPVVLAHVLYKLIQVVW